MDRTRLISISGFGDKIEKSTDETTSKQNVPQAGNADVLQILDLKHFPGLMEFLHSSKRKEVASQLCKSLIASNSALNSTSMVEDLFNFIQVGGTLT